MNTNNTITLIKKKRNLNIKGVKSTVVKKFQAWFKATDTIFKNRAVETCFKNFIANKRFAKLMDGMNQANILRIEEVNNKTLTKVWSGIVKRASKHYRLDCLDAWAKLVRGDNAGKGECPICYTKSKLIKLTCGHGYCETCLPRIKVEKSGAKTFTCAMRCGNKLVKLPKHKIPEKVGAWAPDGQAIVAGVRKTRGGCHDDAYWCSTKKVPRGIDADDEIRFKKESNTKNPKRKGKGEKPSISWARWQECIIDHPNGPPEYAEQWFKRGMNRGDWDDAIKRKYIEINCGVELSDDEE